MASNSDVVPLSRLVGLPEQWLPVPTCSFGALIRTYNIAPGLPTVLHQVRSESWQALSGQGAALVRAIL
jgi:hypothetical protein